MDEDGYVYVMSRIDDVINVAGHRLSTGAMEEVLASHPDVAECAVIGVADALKGEVPLGFVVLKAGVDARRDDDLARAGRSWCASGSGRWPPSRPARVVKRLPKTRSGKILRGTMQKIADGASLQGARHDRRPGDPGRDRGARPRELGNALLVDKHVAAYRFVIVDMKRRGAKARPAVGLTVPESAGGVLCHSSIR